MLLDQPTNYYRVLLEKFPNCYLAEDDHQVILGIDCEYFDSYQYDWHALQKIYQADQMQYQKQQSPASFAGLFGIFAYETIHFFEDIEQIAKEQYKFPSFVFARAKAYLHYDKRSKLYNFYSDTDENQESSKEKYYNFLEGLTFPDTKDDTARKKNFYQILSEQDEEKKHFFKNIETAKEYIRQGDAFQIVLSEQLKLRSDIDSLDFYAQLKEDNPSPYMYHFPTPYGDTVGSSPEILVEIRDKRIFIAPVAGTRPRGKNAAEDETLANDLLNDEKELAEHRMLIDLARNDIGKFSKKSSVVVKNPMHIQYYQHVMHIVSEVYGKQRADVNIFDVISIAFPAGTLSGAPKIRAMQIINELELYKRNIYGGGIGFLHYNEDLQLAILIRTAFFAASKNTERDIFVQAGAGIVYDSVKEKEYQEIVHKRASVLSVFEKLCYLKSEKKNDTTY